MEGSGIRAINTDLGWFLFFNDNSGPTGSLALLSINPFFFFSSYGRL